MLVPLNWRLAAPELRFILEDSGAGAACHDAGDGRRPPSAAAPPGCTLLDAEAGLARRHCCGPRAAAEAGGPEDPVLLVYTSGTTGRPKGAVLDQRALLFNALNAQHAFALTAADRVLTVLPLFHVGGLNIQTTPALLAGAEVVLLPRFDPAATFAAIAAHRPTLTLLVPAVMQAMVAHPGWATADLSSLRAVGAGSSEVPLPLIEAFHARGIPVQQVYGATETGPIAICQTRAAALAAPGCLGQRGAAWRGAGGRRRGARGAARHPRRDPAARPACRARLLERAGGNRGRLPGWLVRLRRCRHARCRRAASGSPTG